MGFSKLNSLKVAEDATRTFRLDGVDLGNGTPTLTVKHAGPSNAAYWAAVLKQPDGGATRSVVRSQERIDAARAEDIKLLAKHVIVGWTNVLEDDPRDPTKTKPCEFSPEKCEEFMLVYAKLAPDHFVSLTNFVGNADNFRTAPAVDGVELGKP